MARLAAPENTSDALSRARRDSIPPTLVRGKRRGRAKVPNLANSQGLSIPRDVSSPRNKSEERVFWRAQATAREASSSSSSFPTPSCRSAATTVRGGPRRRTPRSSASPRVGSESWVSSPRTSRPIRRTSWLRRCVSARSHAPVGFETGVTTRRLPRSFALVRGPNRARARRSTRRVDVELTRTFRTRIQIPTLPLPV